MTVANTTFPEKIVQFSNEIEVETFQIDLSPAMKNKLWYSQMDIDIFRAWASRCVLKLRSATHRYCMHIQQHEERQHHHAKQQQVQHLDAGDIIGLERFSTIDLSQEYTFRHEAVVKAVLDEQRRQRIQRVFSVDRMSKAARESSHWARQNARSAGLYLERSMDGSECGSTSSSSGNIDDESYLISCNRDVFDLPPKSQKDDVMMKQGSRSLSRSPLVRRSVCKRMRTC